MVEEPDEALVSGLEPFRAAGLYDPASPLAGQRAELLRYLLDRFSVEEILYWVEHTNLVGVSARTIDRPPPFISAEDAAARAGVPVKTVIDVRSALGFPVTDPTEPSIPETVVDDVKTFVLGTELYGQDDALAFTRVLGWAATRISEAARALFAGGFDRLEGDSPTELQTAMANELGIVAWTQVQSIMVHVLAEHPLRNVGFAEALVRGELRVALAFVDLVSSTSWAESVSPVEQSEALRRFEMRSSALAADQGARLVKLIGDEAMVVADDPEALCRAAIDICDMAGADPVLPDARGAVGHGLVTARDGDYFGPIVNVVARASKLAAPGEIVVTGEVARFLDPTAWSTVPLRPQELRGVGQAVHLSRAAPKGRGPAQC
jgi:class 3 adenylate cyclase